MADKSFNLDIAKEETINIGDYTVTEIEDIVPIPGCRFCETDDMGDSVSIPLLEENSKLFSEEISAEVQLLTEGKLNLYIGTQHSVFFDKSVKIQFCPMRGRKLYCP